MTRVPKDPRARWPPVMPVPEAKAVAVAAVAVAVVVAGFAPMARGPRAWRRARRRKRLAHSLRVRR